MVVEIDSVGWRGRVVPCTTNSGGSNEPCNAAEFKSSQSLRAASTLGREQATENDLGKQSERAQTNEL